MPLEPLVADQGPIDTLIRDEEWDAYRLDSLLPLKDAYTETTDLGFLLRHYWLPATVLQFRESTRETLPDGTIEQREALIERRMRRCYSSECLWRERRWQLPSTDGGSSHAGPKSQSEVLCSYNPHEQTFRVGKPASRDAPMPVDTTEARRQALVRLPMLAPPPAPVLIGFEWRGVVGDDYMNYRLEAEARVRDTSVLVIRRNGRYTSLVRTNAEAGEDELAAVPVVHERRGVMLFAWKRGAVLEDRFLDRVIEAGGHSPFPRSGLRRSVTRLVRSTPAED